MSSSAALANDNGVIAPVRPIDTGANTRVAIQTWTGKAIGEQIHAKQLDAAYRLSAMLSEKVDVLQILYDRSPVGIVAAVPIMNGQNKTDDARILTLNAKAREILKQDPSRSPMHTVGELVRYLGEGLRWTASNTSSDGQATHVEYRNRQGEVFVMTIELVNQIVLISFAERGRPDTNEAKTTNRFARLLGLG